ncbi:hypothetical protein ACFYZ4_03690 [Streptomyces sp. NPDC001513]|uniref:hypothetical protein n=1 Tax=Streptomyces sp. NPDC001513 TaxID=3364580 RepID=UPI0036B97409
MLFLEVLVLPGRQRSQDSALDIQGKAFRQLCRALRAQATYTACEMPATTREWVRQDAERLIAALGHLNAASRLRPPLAACFWRGSPRADRPYADASPGTVRRAVSVFVYEE